MANTAFRGAYTTPTCTNLTQSITRTATTQPMLSMDLTTFKNYSSLYSMSFAITSSDAAAISITGTTNGLSLTRSGDTYTLTSNKITNGVNINNWAYFKLALHNLNIVTSGTTWPNPAFTIATTLTDGTTSLTGTQTISSLTATTPSTPTLSYSKTSISDVTLTWTASTQTVGTIAGYNVYKNGSGTALATITSGLTYIDTSGGNATNTYTVRAYDSSSTPLLSSLSNTVTANISTTVNPTISTSRNWTSNIVTTTWLAGTKNYSGGSGFTYKIYKNSNTTTPVITTGTLSFAENIADNVSVSYQIETIADSLSSGISSPISDLAAVAPGAPASFTLTRGAAVSGVSAHYAIYNWSSATTTISPGIGGYKLGALSLGPSTYTYTTQFADGVGAVTGSLYVFDLSDTPLNSSTISSNTVVF